MSKPPEIQLALEAHAINGEGPCWDDRLGQLYWVDMRAPRLNVFRPGAGQTQSWEMPGWIGCCAPTRDGRIVVALRTGVHLFDPADGSLRMLAAAPYDSRRFCFNDGRCDRQGRFIVGPMHHPLASEARETSAGHEAPLWRYANGQMLPLPLPPVHTANGLAFSPDGATLYHSDTPTKTVWACDYDTATGEIANRRVFARIEEGGDQGGPDGATVDGEGFYICAVFGGACLLRFDPEGRLERRIELPVQYPTMPALGGEDRSTLFVTSAAFPIPADLRAGRPWDGGLLSMEAPVAGLPTSYMLLPEEMTP